MEGYCRWFETPKVSEIREAERTDVSLVTTASVDRDFEVVVPSGLDWSQYRKNMVVPFAHTYDALPVGKALWVRRKKDDDPTKDGFLAATRYVKKPETWTGDWFPDAVWAMIVDRTIRGKSIGFIPTEVSAPDAKELEKRPELTNVRWMIRKAIVLEYSVAPVQSNPEAIVTAVSKSGGSIPVAIQDALGLVMPADSLEDLDWGNDDDEIKTAPVLTGVVDIAAYKQRLRRSLADAAGGLSVKDIVRGTLNAAKGKV